MKKQIFGIVLLVLGALVLAGLGYNYLKSPPLVPTIPLLLKNEKKLKEIVLEEYLVGVVLAEMPAGFEPEALKAQAVCARTYTLRRYYSNIRHEKGAVVCDDSSHCQAYVDPVRLEAEVPDKGWAIDKVRKAVEATRGQVIICRGTLIDPVYHSTCGGHTISAKTVWGNEYSYLQGVSCPWDKESPHNNNKMIMQKKALIKVLKLKKNENIVPERIEKNDLGYVKKIAWKSREITGTDFRHLLELPSPRFTVSSRGSQAIINTVGYGHGVGLCQYGANGMAKAGYTYSQIIHHYYTGVTLCQLEY